MEARIAYSEERGEWVAVLVEGEKIICVGCESTEEAIHRWARGALRFHMGVEGIEHPQDMYDRAGGNHQFH